jgi:hypothetical protein
MNIDFGKLTNGETKKIFKDAIVHLSNEDIIAALREGLSSGDLHEILEELTMEEEDEEKEDKEEE